MPGAPGGVLFHLERKGNVSVSVEWQCGDRAAHDAPLERV